MKNARFLEIHPVLPVRDIKQSLEFYSRKLGFETLFIDNPKSPMYAGIKRDGVEIHLQWHDANNWKQMNASSVRFAIENIQSLFNEYDTQNVFHEKTALRVTPWNTQEFAFFDPDMNGLTFYRDL